MVARVGQTKVSSKDPSTIRLTDRISLGVLAEAYSFALWQRFRETGADLLWRVTASLGLPVVTPLPDGSYLSIIFSQKIRGRRREDLLRRARNGESINPDDGRLIRVVEYDIPDRDGDGSDEIIRVITSILDPAEATAEELAAAYHERWECEGLIDEVKTHQRGPAKILRSKSPDMVRQEIWAFLLTHHEVRRLMCRAADEIGEDPDRLSFMRSLRVVRRHIIGQADFPPSIAKLPSSTRSKKSMNVAQKVVDTEPTRELSNEHATTRTSSKDPTIAASTTMAHPPSVSASRA